MNFISMSICIEINSQYQNINLCCAIIIEMKNVAITKISTIEKLIFIVKQTLHNSFPNFLFISCIIGNETCFVSLRNEGKSFSRFVINRRDNM